MNDPRRPEMTRGQAVGLNVETSPVGSSSANFRTVEMRLHSPNRLEIHPSVHVMIFAIALAAIGAVMMGVGVLVGLGWGLWLPIVGGAVGGGMCLTASLLMLLLIKRFEFDGEAGNLRIRSLLNAQARPLREIVAVQVISGGYHSSRNKAATYESFQLNLVFNDESRSRLRLSDHADRAWTVAAGRRLSSFLGVPLLDALSGDPLILDVSDPPASVLAVEPPAGVSRLEHGDVLILASHEHLASADAMEASRRGPSLLTGVFVIVGLILVSVVVALIWARGGPVVVNEKPVDRWLLTIVAVGFILVWLAVLRFILGGAAKMLRIARGDVPLLGWRLELRPFEWIATHWEGPRTRTVRIDPRDVSGVDLDPTYRVVVQSSGRERVLTPILDPEVAAWLRDQLAGRLRGA